MDSSVVRVLLVEDEPGDAEFIMERLRGCSAESWTSGRAPSLAAATQALGASPFDLAVADLGFPDSKGLHTLTALRAHAADAALVILTGLDIVRGFIRQAGGVVTTRRRAYGTTYDLHRAAVPRVAAHRRTSTERSIVS